MKPIETNKMSLNDLYSFLEKLKYGNLRHEQEEQLKEENVFTKNVDIFKYEHYPSPKETIKEIEELQLTMQNKQKSDEWNDLLTWVIQIDRNLMQVMNDYITDLGIEFKGDYFKKILLKLNPFIIALKKHYNRPRPYQVAYYSEQKLNPLTSRTSQNPSYPSGHTIQSYFICKIIAFHNPDKEKEIMELAEIVSASRELMGVHYKSDNLFAQYVVDELLQIKEIKDIYFNEKKKKTD